LLQVRHYCFPEQIVPSLLTGQRIARYLIAARQAEALALEQLLGLSRLVVAVSNLIHALQRERGATGIYAGSGGTRFGQQRQRWLIETDLQLGCFEDQLIHVDQALPVDASSRLLTRLATAVHQLDTLSRCRDRASRLQVTTEQVHQYYTDLIRTLLAVVLEVANAATDPDISRALVALFHFMQGKELAGQERALGGMRLASGRTGGIPAERLALLIEGQERCFETFSRFADGHSLSLWHEQASPCDLTSLRQLRHILSQTASDEPADAALSECWFDVCTRRIDAMKQVEDALEENVRQTSEIRLAAARHDLEHYRDDVLAARAPAPPENLPTLGDSPSNAGLGRSLMDLLQSQSRRLHQIEEELEQARAALDERKLVDRAKVMLMKHRGLREEDAHALMRKMAMNQGRKLVDVARAVLSMVDMLE
jgi:hypothetical protein